MPKAVTMMDVYNLYRLFNTTLGSLLRFISVFFSQNLQETFIAKVEAVGRAYCEENNLPFPLPKEKMPKALFGPLELVVLGPRATRAFRELELFFKQSFVINA